MSFVCKYKNLLLNGSLRKDMLNIFNIQISILMRWKLIMIIFPNMLWSRAETSIVRRLKHIIAREL